MGAKFVTSRAEEYRRYARQCLEIAPAFRDEEARATLLGLEQAWLRLTHLALANRQMPNWRSRSLASVKSLSTGLTRASAQR